MSNMSNSVRKAKKTRQARNEFLNRYGETTFEALRTIVGRGRRSFPTGSLAAFKANLTRGSYSDFITVKNGKVKKDRLRISR